MADLQRTRRTLLEVLNEAEQRCGTSALLAALRTGHQRALGEDAPRADQHGASKLAAWEHVALARQLLQQTDDSRAAAATAARLASASPAEAFVAAGLGSARMPAALTGWHLEQALAQEPGHYWAHFYQGVAAFRERRFGDAVMAFRTAVALRPRHPAGYNNRGRAAASAGDLKQALTDYTKALDLDAGFHAAAWNRASIHFKMRNYDAALADLRLAEARGADPQAIAAEIQRVLQLQKTMR